MKKMIMIIGVIVVLAIAGLFFWQEVFDSEDDVFDDGNNKTVDLAEIEKRYNTHFGFLGLLNVGEELVDLGVVWDRPHSGPFNANSIGYEDYDWEEADDYVSDAQDLGVVTLATLWPFESKDQMTCHANEPAATGQFREMPNRLYLPCDTKKYQNFVSALVERYDGDGDDDFDDLRYPIRYWEVSNEPEMQGEGLTFFQGTPEDYAQLLKITAEAIRAADENAIVVQGGAAGAGQKTWDFWNRVFAVAGVSNTFDIANIHSLGSSADLYVEDWKNVLTAHGINKPIWVTEAQFGQNLPGPMPIPGQAANHGANKNQEELVRDGVLLAFAHGADKIFWTTYQVPKFSQGDLAKEMENVAFVDADGTKRPAYNWLKEYVEKLNTFTTVAEADNKTQLQFETPDGVVTYPMPQ